MLKKEFKRKDVDRMRNLITGNANKSSEIQIGYNKKRIDYKEGDIWTENKKTWTIKNGIKQTISKLDNIRKEVFTPLCCPECNNVMKHRFDNDNYRIHKKCFDCVIKFEHKLRIEKKYDQYIKNLKTKNNITTLNEVESYLLEAINRPSNDYVSEDGVIERWVGGVDKTKLTKEVKEAARLKRERLNKELND